MKKAIRYLLQDGTIVEALSNAMFRVELENGVDIKAPSKVAFPSTQELDTFIGKIQRFGNTSTQIVFSTPVPHREIIVEPNS